VTFIAQFACMSPVTSVVPGLCPRGARRRSLLRQLECRRFGLPRVATSLPPDLDRPGVMASERADAMANARDINKNTSDETKYWDGMVCRKDPERARIEVVRALRKRNTVTYLSERAAGLERYRENRLMEAHRRNQASRRVRLPSITPRSRLTPATSLPSSNTCTRAFACAAAASVRYLHRLRHAEPRWRAPGLWRERVPSEHRTGRQ